jgi:phosphoenolpyruvate-protein phosphotransferase (PTS system enzyme I)
MKLLNGIAASPGVAIGQARVLDRVSLDFPETKIAAEDAEAEMGRFRRSVAASAEELKTIRETAEKKLRKEDAEIFGAHLEMLDDPALLDGAASRIREGLLSAESAAAVVIREFAARFEAMEDEYFRARASDVRDVGTRILKNLKLNIKSDSESGAGVLVAEELLPSDTVGLDASRVAGIATEKGGATSHASIIARAMGIPCVVGVEGLLAHVGGEEQIALDGSIGEVFIGPDDATLDRLKRLSFELRACREAALLKCGEPAVTRDGRRILIYANAGSAEDVAEAVSNGAEGIGLFRTEFLFLGRAAMPSEDEQAAEYGAAAAAADGRPVAIRLLDIGGDKPAHYLEIPAEANPFLGLRAVRLLLKRPDVLKTQIRAILRAAAAGDVSIMVPMVTVVSELEDVKNIVAECRSELMCKGVKTPGIPVGMMVEVPAAALCARELARAADYFSIGTNDLTQYCMAVDRGNAAVAGLYRADHPAVLSLIRNTAEAGCEAGIKTSVCGEAAGDERIAPALIAAGVDCLSVAASAVATIKECVRKVDSKETD